MKKIIFLTASFFLPLMSALAHNGVDDGDTVVAPPTADERTNVAIGLGVFVLVVVLVIWWVRRKKP